MLPIESLNLKASQWQFLGDPVRYAAASEAAGRKLVLESTARQFDTARDILERLNGSYGQAARRGVLLADDVGLGKTTVAALVAWIMASAGEKRGVRILAPNDVMARRWADELTAHVAPLQECAPFLDVARRRVKARRVGKLTVGTIQVVKHSYAASDNLSCDLLIIDEAHRAKGENTNFSNALKRQMRRARRVLILTATPFSIRLQELQRMLKLIGGDVAGRPVTAFAKALDDLYGGNTARSAPIVADRLAKKAGAAIEALAGCVIRHSVDELPREQRSFGRGDEWSIDVPRASAEELELLVRMDRAQRVAQVDGVTNSPRFHVGWRFFDAELDSLREKAVDQPQPRRAVLESHCKAMRRLRASVGVHSKMEAVGAAVKEVVQRGEKVVLFCHHHATAQELTAHVASVIPALPVPRAPAVSAWREAWEELLPALVEEQGDDEALRAAFIAWLCSDQIRAQTRSWMAFPTANLASALQTSRARSPKSGETVLDAARSLYRALLQSKSSRAVLVAAAGGRLDLLPGASGAARVLGVCEPSHNHKERPLFTHNRQPDTVISVFNSPFGPDVLVVTDKLSEGIDLHRYCRHLVHYELDPSPIRTVQRNGRVRRVSSWASVTGEPIQYAFPAFRGTRDHRLVQIMKKRIDSFSMLLGGVQDFEVDDVSTSDERWRNEVIALAKSRLEKTGRALQARPIGTEGQERVLARAG